MLIALIAERWFRRSEETHPIFMVVVAIAYLCSPMIFFDAVRGVEEGLHGAEAARVGAGLLVTFVVLLFGVFMDGARMVLGLPPRKGE